MYVILILYICTYIRTYIYNTYNILYILYICIFTYVHIYNIYYIYAHILNMYTCMYIVYCIYIYIHIYIYIYLYIYVYLRLFSFYVAYKLVANKKEGYTQNIDACILCWVGCQMLLFHLQ